MVADGMHDGDGLPEPARDEVVVMRLAEDRAVVLVDVDHGMNEEHDEQHAGELGPIEPEEHAIYAALKKLWNFQRDCGFEVDELVRDFEAEREQ